MSADRDRKGSRRLLRAEGAVPIRAVLHDQRYVCDRLHIVHNRRLGIQAFDGREGRPEPRLADLALERFEQCGFLAADVGACAAVNIEIEVDTRAPEVLAQEAPRVGFTDGPLEHPRPVRVFAADIDVTRGGTDGEARDDQALDQLMRVVVDDLVVVEGSRLRLVRVADQVLREDILGDEAPLHARGEACSPATAQPRGFDLIDHRIRLHRGKDRARRLVAAVLEVDLDLPDVRDHTVAQDDIFFEQRVRMFRAKAIWSRSTVSHSYHPSIAIVAGAAYCRLA